MWYLYRGFCLTQNIPPCSTPSQNKAVRDHVRTILAHTPSHLNVTASADQGSPVSAPIISQTNVKGNITINQNFSVVLQNPSDGYPLPENHSDVREGTDDDYQILPSHNTEQVPQKCESSHRRRHLSFKSCLEQHALTLAEVKKDTNHLREVTVTGKIIDLQPAISILQNEEGIQYSHYILYDTTAKVHLSLADKFIVTINQWYIFKSLSICDFGKGNVLCSTQLTTLESFTPLEDNLKSDKSEETVISGKVTEALLTFEYICSCGATISFSNPKLFLIKCNKCRKSCRCENVQNRAKASVTIKQPNGTDQRVVLNDALLHSIFSFKREGYCDSQQLEDRLLRAERMTVVCVDDEPQRVLIEAVEEAKHVAKKSFFSRCCAF
ncbi:uncharacterized protein LOC113107388 isoform X2 [Carassius auratus]|uniref:Uncharacterized protein LOC113107388 isoform X2 n=1 Tax=Carassius auratus TaxID=7957 RepID=A0A6P6PWW0_CARAU|nr:uncharacterized protein LOC113107388 isoform X2 [Carassius auratus]